MGAVQASRDKVAVRGQQIRRLLSNISKQQGGPAWTPKIVRREVIIGTHDGAPTNSDYRSWRFATHVTNYRARYFERWIELDKLFYLDRAYLSIFRTDRVTQTETEFLCLHCDPREPDDAPHSLYKQGPHLHVIAAEQPIPHSHIALALTNLDVVLSSVEALDSAIETSLLMIRRQFLDALSN